MIKFNREPPCINKMYGNGVQLLPNNNQPYIIELPKDSIYDVYIVDIYGNEKLITTTEVFSKFLTLKNIDFDDANYCYLKVVDKNILSIIKFYYSEPIKISSYQSNLTTRIDYKCKESDVLLSSQICIYERNSKRSIELDTYYEVSKKRQVSYVKSSAKYYRYLLNTLNIDVYDRLLELFSGNYVYFDFVRVNLFDAVEFPDPEGDAYFIEGEINITKKDENIKPNYHLVTEQEYTKESFGYICNYDYNEIFLLQRYRFTGGKFYEEYQGEVEKYIVDDYGAILYNYIMNTHLPNDLFTAHTEVVKYSKKITTENKQLINV